MSGPPEQPVSILPEAMGRAEVRGTGLSRESETSGTVSFFSFSVNFRFWILNFKGSQSAASAEVRAVDNQAAFSQNNLPPEADELVADFSDDDDEEARRVYEQRLFLNEYDIC